MNKAKNVERMTTYVKKVNALVEKKKQNIQLFPQLRRLHSEASGSSRMLCKNLSSNFCFHGRRWCYRCTVCAHDFTSERFLLIRAFYHIYFTVKVKVGTSHGKGSTPLTGSGLCFISARRLYHAFGISDSFR